MSDVANALVKCAKNTQKMQFLIETSHAMARTTEKHGTRTGTKKKTKNTKERWKEHRTTERAW